MILTIIAFLLFSSTNKYCLGENAVPFRVPLFVHQLVLQDAQILGFPEDQISLVIRNGRSIFFYEL